MNKSRQYHIFILLLIAAMVMSLNAHAASSTFVDTDSDLIHDAVDADPNTPSSTFAFPDVCKTPSVSGPVPTPYPDYPYTLRYGLRRVLSDFSDDSQGPVGNNPKAVATDASGEIFVLTPTALYHVDPTNGFRTELSDFTDTSQGPTIYLPSKLAVDDSGMIFVTDTLGGPSLQGFIFKIDPLSGVRTVLYDFDGQVGHWPDSVTVEASGDILVTDQSGLLSRINSASGLRTVLSDFSDPLQGPLLAGSSGVAVDDTVGIGSPRILVTSTSGFVLSVDPVSGFRTVVSDTSDPAQQALGIRPSSVAVEDSGGILVVDSGTVGTDSRGALVFVDPWTGIRQFLSDFGFAAQGPLGLQPSGVAVGAAGVVYVTDLKGVNESSLGTLFEITLHKATSGSVKKKGGQKVKVTETDPDRHRPGSDIAIITDNTGGPALAAPYIPGGSVISAATGGLSGTRLFMSASDKVTVSSGSVTIDVVSGPVEIQFLGDAGIEANTSLEPGNSVTFEPTTLTLTAPSTNTELAVILIEDVEVVLAPGETINLADTDGDGIPDDQDECPESDTRQTVIIDGCDSGVPNIFFDDGCTIADQVMGCAEGAKNHGKFVSCVAKLTNSLKKAGIITGKQKGAIQSCAAQASIP